MPELPEVETIRTDLLSYIQTGFPLQNVQFHDEKYFLKNSNISDPNLLEGQILMKVERYGKVLLLHLDTGILGFHLGMSGQFVSDLDHTDYPQHLKLNFQVENRMVYFIDIRKFGWVKFEPELNPLLPSGIDPLTDTFTTDYLHHNCIKGSRPIKVILMDQQLIAGLGNIYACETLFRTGIHPGLPGNQLSDKKIDKLFNNIIEVLRDGIKNYGTTFSMFRNLRGDKGSQQNFLNVYGREGLKCRKCSQKIQKTVIAGRSSFYCPNCQKI